MPQERLYDMVLLVTPEKDEQGTAAVIDEFRKLLLEKGATLQKDETMGRRRLAFTIRKKNEATYHNFLFNGSGACVKEVERKLGLSENVLRYLTVRVDEEMRHGQKVAKRTKPRLPRRTDASPTEMAPSAPAVSSAPAASEPPAAEPPRE